MTTVIDYATTNLTQILAGLNVLSFLLGLLVAMIIYKPKLAAMKRYCEEIVKDKMAEKLRGIESLLGRGRPTEREVRRIPIAHEDIQHLYKLMDAPGIHGRWMVWTFLGEAYPATKVGQWQVNTNEIAAPVLIQLAEEGETKPLAGGMVVAGPEYEQTPRQEPSHGK